MKPWVWFAIAALWLILPQVAIHNGGLMVGVMTGKYPDNVALATAAALMNLIVWGWLMPLSIGLLRLARKRFGR